MSKEKKQFDANEFFENKFKEALKKQPVPKDKISPEFSDKKLRYKMLFANRKQASSFMPKFNSIG